MCSWISVSQACRAELRPGLGQCSRPGPSRTFPPECLMVLDDQRGPGAHAPWAPCTDSPTAPLSKLLVGPPLWLRSAYLGRGSLSPPLLSGGSSGVWDPEAVCAPEGWDPIPAFLPHPPTPEEASDLDAVEGGLVGDIIEQQQCWGKGSEDLPEPTAPAPSPPPAGQALPAPAPVTPVPPGAEAWGPWPCAHHGRRGSRRG